MADLYHALAVYVLDYYHRIHDHLHHLYHDHYNRAPHDHYVYLGNVNDYDFYQHIDNYDATFGDSERWGVPLDPGGGERRQRP